MHRWNKPRSGRPQVCVNCGCRRKYIGRTPYYSQPMSPRLFMKDNHDCDSVLWAMSLPSVPEKR